MSHPIPTAKDMMNTAVRTAEASEDIEDAMFKMRRASIHHLPVLDSAQRLVGVATFGELQDALSQSERARQPLESAMRRDPITVPPSMRVDEIIELMIEKRIGCVPVVDDDGFLAGILTETDFLHLALAHVREKVQRYSEGTGYRR